MVRHSTRLFSAILATLLMLSCVSFSAAAQAQEITVSADIDGGEIYRNGVYSGFNTPAQISAETGDTVSVVLPGYTCTPEVVTAGTDTCSFTLQPELYPVEYAAESKHTTLDVGDGYPYANLDAALLAMQEISADIWCVIVLHEDADTAHVPSEDFRLRDHYTIYGTEKHTCFQSGINPWGVDGLRLFNLDFTGMPGFTQFSIRAEADTVKSAVNTKNIYVCGCSFLNANEFGVYQCVPFQKGGTAYDSEGTYNVSNLNFSNNDITYEGMSGSLFNFAAAGDGDYNVISDYTVMANRFEGSGIGFLTADAHSWYVYCGSYESGGDMSRDEIGVCEHNVIRNILISGNRVHNGSISVQSANLGNQNNLLENAVIRNNRVTDDYKTVDGPDSFECALSVTNVVVADNYEGDRYYVKPGLTHTDGNQLRNVAVYGNYFETGRWREAFITNVLATEGQQCGANNTMADVRVENNEFVTACGVIISNYGQGRATADSQCCANNTMTDITFAGNTVTNPMATDSVGINVCGSYLSKHGEQYDDYADYTGTMERIYIRNNTVNDYIFGISAAGCFGDFIEGNSISDLEISGNTVTNKNQFSYAVTDVGILIAGATGQTYSQEYSPAYPGRNGSLSNVTVKGNTVTARCGIAAAGLVAKKELDKPSVNNTISSVRITENTIYQRPQQAEFVNMGDPNSTAAGIIAADVIAVGDRLKTDTYSEYALTAGSSAEGILIENNVIAPDFAAAILNGTEQMDSTWSRLTQDGREYAKTTVGACIVMMLHDLPPQHIHADELTPVAAKNPTCTEAGSSAYYVCSCGLWFADAAAQNEITDHSSVVLAALNHDWLPDDDNSVAPTCTEPGTGSFKCSRCTATKSGTIEPLGHYYIDHEAKAPTCTTVGWTAYQTCSRCDYTTYTEIASLGHNFADGKCTRCGEADPDYEAKDPCEGYTDIDRKSWYHTAVDFVISRGLMGSTKANTLTFEPNTKVSRAMVASILYRMAGSPEVEYKATFTDVPAGKWFSNAIEWCAQNGLASGKGAGKFDPNGNVTRQELAVFMKKMAEHLKADTSAVANLSGFTDYASVPAWSKDYVAWAVAAGLISGKASGGKTYLAPTDNATRAEFASILMRFTEHIQ